MDEIGVPDEVVPWLEPGDGDQAALELEVWVEDWVELLGVAGQRAVEDAVLGVVEGPVCFVWL